MKIILMIISLIFLANFAQADTKVNCQSALAKLKPSCNVVGDALKKMKKFSAENQTLGDTYKNIKNKKSK